MGWFVTHLLVTVLVCVTMSVSGFGLNTWQYWVVLVGIALSHTFGRAHGEEK